MGLLFRDRDPASDLERLRRRLGPRQALVPIAHARWSDTCWRCGSPCGDRRLVAMRIFTSALVAHSTEGIEIAVPICADHGRAPWLAPLVRMLRFPVGFVVFAAIFVATASPFGPVRPGLAVAKIVGAVVAGVIAALPLRAWADRHDPHYLVWTGGGRLGWCIVGFDDPARAARIRAEIAAAMGWAAPSDGDAPDRPEASS